MYTQCILKKMNWMQMWMFSLCLAPTQAVLFQITPKWNTKKRKQWTTKYEIFVLFMPNCPQKSFTGKWWYLGDFSYSTERVAKMQLEEFLCTVESQYDFTQGREVRYLFQLWQNICFKFEEKKLTLSKEYFPSKETSLKSPQFQTPLRDKYSHNFSSSYFVKTDCAAKISWK